MSGVYDAKHKSPERASGPIKRLIIPIGLIVVCLSTLSAAFLIDARRAAWNRAVDVASRLAAAVASDMSHNFETLDLSLQAVVENLKHPGVEKLSPDLRNLVLFDRSATARHLGSVLVLDEKGDVRFDSRSLTPIKLNLSDRDYFQVHKDNASVGMYISRPFIRRVSEDAAIAISRRLSHPDGSFAGVVVGSMRLSSMHQLFADVSLGVGSTITLARRDGIVLMRWPYRAKYIGLDLKHADIFKRLAVARSGYFETNALTDDVHRLFYYTQIDDLPLVVAVGQSTAVIYASWDRYAVILGLMIFAFCASGVVLAYRLFRELKRRNEAEAKLAVLASTDSLTGLANRRHLKETLRREWRRAVRETTSLALLIVDVDFFKDYNDRNGHQAGDLLLQSLGSAINMALKREGDIGARYGGDEFAILLPGTSGQGAARLADVVRDEFSRVCRENSAERPGLSIGVSCLSPRAADAPYSLIKAADDALYRAKRLGRNRTEITVSGTATFDDLSLTAA